MKIDGKKIDSKPTSETLYFPHGDQVIPIRATAVMDRSEFDKLCPLPKPPKKRIKGGSLVDNPDDPRFKISLDQHSTKYINWLIISSLCSVKKETDEDIPIEWELLDRNDPSTWDRWEEDLKQSGFSDMERKRIHGLVISVNSLSDARLDEARNSFLQPKDQEQDPSYYPTTENNATPSGEPVKDSESALQESQNVGTTSQI